MGAVVIAVAASMVNIVDGEIPMLVLYATVSS